MKLRYTHFLSLCLLFVVSISFGQAPDTLFHARYNVATTGVSSPAVATDAVKPSSPSKYQLTGLGNVWSDQDRGDYYDGYTNVGSGNLRTLRAYINAPLDLQSSANRLRFRKTNASTVAYPTYAARTANFTTNNDRVVVSFDMFMYDSESADTDAMIFYAGSNFTNDSLAPNPADVYARISIQTIGQQYKFKVAGKDSTFDMSGGGFLKFYWVMNNGSTPYTYYDYDGNVNTIAPDKVDLWVFLAGSRIKVFTGVAPQNPGQVINNFKILFQPTRQTEIAIRDFTVRGLNSIASILPVTYTSFKARATDDNQKVEVSWVTASERNSDHFMVQRSQDLEKFEDVSYRKAAGNSDKTINYTAIDESPLLGTTYYRLKQVDTDGTTEYSRPVAVSIEDPSAAFKAYPNPNDGDKLMVQVANTENLEVNLLTTTGLRVPAQVNVKSKNIVELSPLQKPQTGMYIVQAISEGVVKATKVVVK